jgi:hypothetical protein
MLYESFLYFQEIARTKYSLFTAVSVWLQKTGVNTRQVVETHTNFKVILNKNYACNY